MDDGLVAAERPSVEAKGKIAKSAPASNSSVGGRRSAPCPPAAPRCLGAASATSACHGREGGEGGLGVPTGAEMVRTGANGTHHGYSIGRFAPRPSATLMQLQRSS